MNNFSKIIKGAICSMVILSSLATTVDASVNPKVFGSIQAENKANFVKLDVGQQLVKSAAFLPNAEPVLVAWSIKGAYKKAKKAAKNVGRTTGRVVRKANRIIVPSEIRHGASFVYGKTKRGAKHIYRHPYGKRCKPNKYLQPLCTVKGKGRANIHDHRS